MMGLAQKNFDEKQKKHLSESSLKDESNVNESFSSVDEVIADFLLKDVVFSTETLKSKAYEFICRLFLAAREGHLCLESLEEIELDSTLITKVSKDHLTTTLKTPICKFKNLYYLRRYWIQETFFLHNFLKIIHQKPTLNINQIIVDKLIAQYQEEKKNITRTSPSYSHSS